MSQRARRFSKGKPESDLDSLDGIETQKLFRDLAFQPSVPLGIASETNRRARFYSLTEQGQARLAEEKKNWERLTRGVGQVLEFA